MSVLELYDERYRLEPLTADDILAKVEAAERILLSDVRPPDLVDERLICWLHDRLRDANKINAKLTADLEDLRGRKLGNGDAWAEAASEATGMYEYQRKLHEALKATIRSLLTTELPSGELRKAIEELVR